MAPLHTLKLFCLMTTGLSCALHLPAQHLSLDSVQMLEEVTVTATRYREVIPAQKLSGEKLEALASFSVADAIRYFSGVQIKDYGGVGGLKTVDIRSMGTNHMGVFYDGIQLGNAQNGQIDLGKFSLDNIEEISLYNGQKSDIFQSARDFGSAGVIYLRTRRPRFAEGRQTNLKAFFRTGSFDLANPSLLWEQKLSERVSSSLNVEYIYSSGKYPFRYRRVFPDGKAAWDTTAVRQNGDIHSVRLEGGLNGYTDRGKWNVKGYFYDSEKGIPGAIVNNVWKRSQRQWDRNFFMQGSFQEQLSGNCEVLANVKYADDRMRYLNPDTTLMYIDNTFRQQEFYVSTAGRYTLLPQWDVSLAVDYQWNTLSATLQDFVYPRRNTVLAALATAFEWRRLKGQASVLGTCVFENVTRLSYGDGNLLPGRQTGKPDNRQEYTPAVFLSFRPFPSRDFHVQAFYKRIFRMPTFNDLYYTDVGNVSLRPEFTTQYNLGCRYVREYEHGAVRRLDVKVDAYYNEVTDKIVAIPKGNGQYRWMMMNLGYVEIRGVDVSGQAGWQLPQGVRLQTGLTYTFQRAQDFGDPTDNDPRAGTYGGQIAYIPWHNGSAIVNAQWKSWDMNYSFIYVGERYHNSSNIRENHEQPWYTHDLTLGRTLTCRAMKFKLSAEVNNLLNQQYDVVLNYPMPGRNCKLILRMEL
ncbi:MAG: TonB-dependent receptor plug domain-containing protein [Tannerella sp.]|jgi:outer membrane cobalamin receptor|nr:TonB-dependent receptor plug domain-containing protein [Tannerella sp.]